MLVSGWFSRDVGVHPARDETTNSKRAGLCFGRLAQLFKTADTISGFLKEPFEHITQVHDLYRTYELVYRRVMMLSISLKPSASRA